MQGLIIMGTVGLVQDFVVIGDTQFVAFTNCEQRQCAVLWFVQKQVTLCAESK